MKGLSVKLDPLEQTTRWQVGQTKLRMYLEERTNRRLSLSLDRGHEGRSCEVLWEDSCSSMYKDIIVCFKTVWRKMPWFPVLCYLLVLWLIHVHGSDCNADWCFFFHRLEKTMSPMSLFLNSAPSRTVRSPILLIRKTTALKITGCFNHFNAHHFLYITMLIRIKFYNHSIFNN
jgi:hypothetical protein